MNDDIYALADDVILKKTGERLKSLRLKQNITQESMADRSQLSLSAIKRMEKGDIHSMESLIRYLRMLRQLDYLEDFVMEEPISPNEYYKMLHASKNQNNRKRASKKIVLSDKIESEW